MLNSSRRCLVIVAILFVFATPAGVLAEIPESSIRYSIEVQLDPDTRNLQGREIIEWTNTLAEPVTSLPMHLYLNAFSNEGSTFHRYTAGRASSMDTILKRFPDPWGWTEPSSIRQNNEELIWNQIAPDDGNHLDRSLIEIELAEP